MHTNNLEGDYSKGCAYITETLVQINTLKRLLHKILRLKFKRPFPLVFARKAHMLLGMLRLKSYKPLKTEVHGGNTDRFLKNM